MLGCIYIAQAARELFKCKVGKTADLEQRLRQYNSMTGKSAENVYEYLFACEVEDMAAVERDFTMHYKQYREHPRREIYLCNEFLFNEYKNFLKNHTMYVSDVDVAQYNTPKPEVQVVVTEKVVPITTPTLKKRGITPTNILNQAKKTKNDEFYTQYEDVEKEVRCYPKELWLNKVVYCNCDDAADDDDRKCSAFTLFFKRNFVELGLKKLICTHYNGGVDLFRQGKRAYVATYVIEYELENGEVVCKKKFPPNYDGSFDHPLSVDILNHEADIVCTNPPFSRARDYWKLLIDSGKQFLIISNQTNVNTRAYMQYFMDNKVWAGYNDACWFFNQKMELKKAAGFWYTNFHVENRPLAKNIKVVPLNKIPDKYKYVDDNKILVVHNNFIPKGYKKPFAVSVYPILSGILEMGYRMVQNKDYTPHVNGKAQFGHVLVQKV